MIWLNGLETLAVAAVCVLTCRYYLHMLQLESYQLDGYQRWLDKNHDKLMGWTLNIGVLATAAYYALYLVFNMIFGAAAGEGIATLAVLAGFTAAAWRLNETQYTTPPKKPLSYTPRMKRLFSAACVLALAAAALLNWMGLAPYLLFIGIPYLALVAGYAMQPVEKRINQHYFNDARAKLQARPDLIKIGITGSYGKTSTKFILAAILSEKFDVYATPASFNTPMGLTRVIREQIEPHHQIFLAEMGARHEGDIRELCELVHPQYGVLTSVGPQHLETFGSVEKVAQTKYELIDSLPADGAAFFAADGGWVDRLYERCTLEKYRTGLTGGYLSMYAEDVTTGSYGSRFTLCDGQGGRESCETRLLGRHNIENILLCCAVARRLGMTLPEIARGVRKTQPVEHRLQLMNGANNMTIIDDAFNTNPVGAAAALDVLASFERRRVIVTPGMVEQGEREAELNYRFGTQMNGKCDVAILVGRKHTAPIAQGLLAAGFDKNNLYAVNSLDEASAVLARIGMAGDVVLFENDLPDNYNEA